MAGELTERPRGQLTADEERVLKAAEALRDAAIEGCVSHVKAWIEGDGRSFVLEIDNTYRDSTELQMSLKQWEGP